MKLYYIPPKDGQKFATVGTSKWDDVNSQLEFSELVITEDETFYILFGNATLITNVGQIEDKGWIFKEPSLIKLKIARRDYDKRKGQETVPTEQSLLEKVLCKKLDSLDKSIPYKGNLNLQFTPMLDMMVTGIGYDGLPVPEATFNLLMQGYIKLEAIPALTTFTLDDCQVSSSSNGKGSWGKGGGFKSQTEYEKFKDKEKFILETIKSAANDLEITSLGQLVQHLNEGGKHSALISGVLEYARLLMG